MLSKETNKEIYENMVNYHLRKVQELIGIAKEYRETGDKDLQIRYTIEADRRIQLLQKVMEDYSKILAR